MNKLVRHLIFRFHLNEMLYEYELKHRNQNKEYSEMSMEDALQFITSISPDSHGSSICHHRNIEVDCELEIIVPCYNVEMYVAECLDSILSQKTKYSYFLTVVNDGSKDNTGKVLERYENISNVKILTQENAGLAAARNLGLSQAHGKYIMFVDSDDVLLPDAIEGLMSLAYKVDADIVDSGHIRFVDPETSHGVLGNIKKALYDKMAKPFLYKYNEDAKSVSGYAWGKVIRSTIFKDIQYPEGYWYEDTVSWMIFEPMCMRKATLDKCTVKYRMRQSSITHTATKNAKSLDIVYVTLQLLKDRELLGMKMTLENYNSLLYQIKLNARQISTLSMDVQYAVFVIHKNIVCKRYKNVFCTNKYYKPLEDFLENNDFDGYRLWCYWH